MKKTALNATCAALVAGVVASAAPLPASAASPLAPSPSAAQAPASVQTVQYYGQPVYRSRVRRAPQVYAPNRFVYVERRHGPRYRYRRRGYDHFYDGYYYSTPFWLGAAAAGVIGGAGAGAVVRERDEYDDYEAHVAWCEDRYRTYDVRSDTYIARRGGPRVPCVSPFL